MSTFKIMNETDSRMSVAEMANPVAAAEDLLKPDIEPAEEQGEEEEDELEALRLAALNSIRPKKKTEPTGFELKKHPERNNLVSIVIPSAEDQVCSHYSLIGDIPVACTLAHYTQYGL